MGLFDRILGRQDAGRPLASKRTSRSDGYGGRWVNASTGQGGAMDRHAHTEFHQPIALDQHTIDSLLQFHAMAKRLVCREPDDATREGYTMSGVSAELGKAVIDAADGNEDDGTPGLGILNAVSKARKWARAYGGGAIYVLADDGKRAHEPLDTSTLRRINGLEVMDRHELVVSAYGTDPNDRRTFNRPLMYSTAGHYGVSERVHATRVVAFHGNELPMRVQLRNGGWGGSVLDLCWSEIRNLSTTNDMVAEAVTLLTQGVFKSKHLADTIDAGDEVGVASRIEALRAAMGVLGDVVIDKDLEEYEIHARPLTGIKDAVDVLANALVAASDMPRSVLLGLTPGGLNTGDNLGELESWYGHVASLQPQEYEPRLRRLLGLLMLSSEGPTRGQLPPGWGVSWAPLWMLDEKEQADVDLRRAQRRSVDINSGAVSADEARHERTLVQLYGHDPNTPAPTPPGNPPEATEGEIVEGDEAAENEGLVATDPSKVKPGEPLVPTAVVANRTGFSPSTILKMAKAGDFPAFYLRGRWRFQLSSVEESINGSSNLRALP